MNLTTPVFLSLFIFQSLVTLGQDTLTPGQDSLTPSNRNKTPLQQIENRFRSMDLDQNGVLDPSELPKMMLDNFDQLDKNKDKKISRSEFPSNRNFLQTRGNRSSRCENDPDIINDRVFKLDFNKKNDNSSIYIPIEEYVDGVRGSAFSFDGNDSFIHIFMNSQFNRLRHLKSGTISFWFKANNLHENKPNPLVNFGDYDENKLFSKSSNNGMLIEVGHFNSSKNKNVNDQNTNRLSCAIWTERNSQPNLCFQNNDIIRTGDWYHYALVIGDNKNTFYINGKEILIKSYNYGNHEAVPFFKDLASRQSFVLGKAVYKDELTVFDGLMDEFFIYDRVLCPKEIMMLYELKY